MASREKLQPRRAGRELSLDVVHRFQRALELDATARRSCEGVEGLARSNPCSSNVLRDAASKRVTSLMAHPPCRLRWPRTAQGLSAPSITIIGPIKALMGRESFCEQIEERCARNVPLRFENRLSAGVALHAACAALLVSPLIPIRIVADCHGCCHRGHARARAGLIFCGIAAASLCFGGLHQMPQFPDRTRLIFQCPARTTWLSPAVLNMNADPLPPARTGGR